MAFWSRLKRTFRGEDHHAEIDEEIQFHLAMKERDGGNGREAKLRFGNPTAIREQTRAMGIFEWLESIVQDAGYGLRQLRRTPALTLSVIVSLVVGIGANTAIYSIVDAALLRSLPVNDPASLRTIGWTNQGWPKELCNSHSGTTDGEPEGVMRGSSIAPRLYRKLAREQNAFESLMGFSDTNRVGVAAHARVPEQVELQYVSDNFFQGLGVAPIAGRAFVPADDETAAEPVVIISHRLWQRLFANADLVDQTLHVNGAAPRIIGVAPPGFFGVQVGAWVDVYAPFSARAALQPREGQQPQGDDGMYWWVRQMGRLKPGADAGDSVTQLSRVFERLIVPEGVTLEAWHIPTLLMSDGRRGFDSMGDYISQALWILVMLVGLVLLIVCANVANLLLSRAVARQRESAVRLALGAPRMRLLRQQLVESLVLAGIAGGLGLGLGYLLAVWAQASILDGMGVENMDLHPNLRMFAYTAGISMVTALIFGIAPAVRVAQADLNHALKAQSRGVLTGRLRLPRVLVVAQIGLCLTVLVAAGLLGHSLAKLKDLDIGFERENIVYASLNPWQSGYQPAQVRAYAERMRNELAAQPGILRVATIAIPLLHGGSSSTTANIAGRPYRRDGTDTVMLNGVSDGLLETLGVPLLLGRTFEPRDTQPKSGAAVVDEAFVKHFFPDQNPLGQRFGTGPDETDSHEIIGVVQSTRYDSLRREILPTMYLPLLAERDRGSNLNFVIRAGIDSQQIAKMVRDVAASVDREVPVNEIRTQTELIDHLLRTERLLSFLSGGFGVIALIVAAVGLAGLLAYAVERRRNEVGIRMALGATRGDVIRMVLSDSLRLVAIGILIGLPGAYAIGRLLRGALYDLEPADPTTAVLSLSVLAAVAALAAWVPASRAARIDPMNALRDE